MKYESVFVKTEEHQVFGDDDQQINFREEAFVSDKGVLYLCADVSLYHYVTDYECGFVFDNLNCFTPVKIRV